MFIGASRGNSGSADASGPCSDASKAASHPPQWVWPTTTTIKVKSCFWHGCERTGYGPPCLILRCLTAYESTDSPFMSFKWNILIDIVCTVV